jgi:Biotin-requiring enzyme
MPVTHLRCLDASGALPETATPFRLESVLKGDVFKITLPEGTYEGSLTQTEPGTGWLILCQGEVNKIVPFCLLQNGDRLDLWVDGHILALERLSPNARRTGASGSASGTHSGEIKAPLPGMILNVLVKPGDTVEHNTPLVVLESMKMETTLAAPMAATVKTVSASEGQMAEKGMVLIQLTPLQENAPAS